jgi:hypothetical protein
MLRKVLISAWIASGFALAMTADDDTRLGCEYTVRVCNPAKRV